MQHQGVQELPRLLPGPGLALPRLPKKQVSLILSVLVRGVLTEQSSGKITCKCWGDAMMPVVAQIYSPRSVNASLPHCLFCTFLWCISSHPWENLCKLAALQNVQCAMCSVQCAPCSVHCRVAKCARREHGNTWRLPPSFKLISLQMLNVATSHLPPCNASQFLEIQKLRKGRGGHIRPKLSWRSGAIARNTLLRTVSAWILTDIFSKPMRNMRSLEKPQHPINGYYESILLFHALPALFHDSAWDNHHPRF